LTTPITKQRLAAALAPWRADLAVASLLFVATTLFSGWYLVTQVPSIGYAYRLSTEHFTPAAMFAEGARYYNPEPAQVPGLQEFLNEASDTFELTAPPPEHVRRPLSWFHQNHAYLMATVSLAWRVFGVSWFVFRGVIAVMAGTLAVAAYAVLRLGAGHILSAILALLFSVAPVTLTVMPNIRDFAKAPFIVAACGLMFWLAQRGRSDRALHRCAIALGLLIGIGFGFRSDVMVCIPPAVIVLLVSAHTPGKSAGWRARFMLPAKALGAFFAALLISAAPILFASQQSETASAAHDIICGLSTESEKFLGVSPASYERVYYFWDGYAVAIGSSYSRRVLGDKDPLPRYSAGAVLGQQTYVLHTFLHFPGDMLARAYASSWRILGDGFARVDEYRADRAAYGYPDNPFVDGVVRALSPLSKHLEQFKLFYVVTALMLLASRDPRSAWAALLLGMYFTGYSCLQFHVRHYFHLTLFTFWILAVLISTLTAIVRHRESLPPWRTALLRTGTFALCALALILLPLQLARTIQKANVGATLRSAAASELKPLPTHEIEEDGWVRHDLNRLIESPPEFDGPQVWEVQGDLLAVELDGSDKPRTVQIKYVSEAPFNNFTHDVVIPPLAPGGTVRYYFPIYQSLHQSVLDQPPPTGGFDGRWGLSRYWGIGLRPEDRGAYKGTFRVTDETPFPLFYHFVASKDLELFRYWQGIEIWKPS